MSFSERDKKVVWHPFTPLLPQETPIHLVRGEGACLIDEQGNSYIDAFSSWWVNLHGHCHPYIAEKISAQLKTLEHAVFAGYTHTPAVEFAERLLQHIPYHSKVFYSDNGSTAVEVALKMAFQYWHNKEEVRTKVIAFEGAYHGDTFGGMSVGARNQFNRAFSPMLFEVEHIPFPEEGKEQKTIEAFKKALASGPIASFIVEPLVQGAAGMRMYDAGVLNELFALSKKHQVITIADEVMTGFGRTGKFLAVDHVQHKPDIICLSKGITGGFMPFGATTCAAFIHDAYITSDRYKTFFHGHSYTGNPLACTAALASLDLLEKETTNKAIAFISEQHQEFANRINQHKAISAIRQQGTILAIELHSAEGTSYLNPLGESIPAYFFKHGIIMRPLGNVLYILPPYCISSQQLNKIYAAVSAYLESIN